MTQASHEVRIAPSLLAADVLRLGEELGAVRSADLLHFDVMDGSFVPNLSFGPDVLRRVHAASEVPIDAHLMVVNPDEVALSYVEAGASNVTFHWEAARHAHRLAGQLHEAGATVGIALNPATPVWVLRDILCELDLVLVMSVNPGFGGQSFIEHTYAKLRDLVALCRELRVSPRIEVDGGIGPGNIGAVRSAGADTFVAGSSVFGATGPAAAIRELRLRAAGGAEVVA